MSLVGSLEDLGLGDILQIVSLSRKSGLLLIRSEAGDGRIVFCEGLVRAAYIKGEPEELGDLLARSGFVTSAELDRLRELAGARGVALEEVVGECSALTRDRLDSLRREHVERMVLQVFSWGGGEFSFEVRDQIDSRDREILIATGINAQFLTMEATRLGDEGVAGAAPGVLSADDDPLFSGEDESGRSTHRFADGVAAVHDPSHLPMAPAVLAESTVGCEAPELEVVAVALPSDQAAAGDATVSGAGGAPCLIAIDPRLSTLEWQKATLAELFERVHIFQNSESGLDRIRQYLRRGRVPVVLISIDLGVDPSSGSLGANDFARRLKLLAPSMPVLINQYDGSQPVAPPAGADAVVAGPAPAYLANRRKWEQLEDAAKAFRTDIASWVERAAPEPVGPPGAPGTREDGPPSEDLERLRVLSERICDPSMHGEVLSLVLEFAAHDLDRVAMFMVRDAAAVGLAQRGLDRGGGPSDEEFRNLELPAMDVEWFRSVLESGSPIRSGPIGKGDRDLLERLGGQVPAEAYLAPICSGDRVVALLYADNAFRARPIADTTILEVALHQAGLALERALLERALARATESR